MCWNYLYVVFCVYQCTMWLGLQDELVGFDTLWLFNFFYSGCFFCLSDPILKQYDWDRSPSHETLNIRIAAAHILTTYKTILFLLLGRIHCQWLSYFSHSTWLRRIIPNTHKICLLNKALFASKYITPKTKQNKRETSLQNASVFTSLCYLEPDVVFSTISKKMIA